MRRLFVATLLALLASLTLTPPAQATTLITITEPTHRQLDGAFVDDDLATLLSYNGSLGAKIFAPTSRPRIWQIDPALIDEIQSMTQPYVLADGTEGTGSTAAQIWLARLKTVTRGDQIVAAPYGNPSGYWIKKLLPHDESYFLTVGAEKLQAFFGRPVSVSIVFMTNSQFRLNSLVYQSFLEAKRVIAATASYMSSEDLERFRLRTTAVLNPYLSPARRDFLARDTTANTFALTHKIRVASSKFTVTSENQLLPITVINDFPAEAKLKIYISALNSKVVTQDEPQDVVVAGKSKVQIKIPVQVVTSGESALVIKVRNERGALLSEPTTFPLKLSVISPIATWVTTGAAVTLFAAAIVQSARRIRKKRT
jgi:hypothetical protein